MGIFKGNRNLLIISLIAIVNALGYGIIIPILYSYSQKYGLTDFQNGLLFALYSVFQFFSTPIIGRLSDKFGRKPLLLISITGTAISFIMTAFAPNAFFLFFARALDGATAGNIPVASAVISDSTSNEERARGFGVIGASFGFGFVFGPAISALTVGISPSLPFIIAAIVSVVAVIMTALFLPETNKHLGEVAKGKLFNFKKLYEALFDKNIGAMLVITLIYFLAFFSFVYAFQPYSVKTLHLSANIISAIFTMVGVIGLGGQLFMVPRLTKRFGVRAHFTWSLLGLAIAFFMMFLFNSFWMFIFSLMFMSISNSVVQPLTGAIISLETDAASQGSILGLSSSYMSIGQILGPIVGGALATYSITFPFLAASVFVVLCFVISQKAINLTRHESAF